METNPGMVNLVSWWKLDEASGNALDSHSTNELVETIGTIASAAGKVNNARDFEDGDTEYFEIASNASLQFADAAFSIGCWYKPESTGGGQYIMGKWNQTNNRREYVLVKNASGEIRFIISQNGTDTTTVLSGVTPSAGTWYFIVARHDPASNTIHIKVSASADVSAAHSTGCNANTSPFRIGAEGSSTPIAGTYTDGLVDEAFLFNDYLTDDEIDWLYNSGNGRTYDDLLAGGGQVIFFD